MHVHFLGKIRISNSTVERSQCSDLYKIVSCICDTRNCSKNQCFRYVAGINLDFQNLFWLRWTALVCELLLKAMWALRFWPAEVVCKPTLFILTKTDSLLLFFKSPRIFVAKWLWTSSLKLLLIQDILVIPKVMVFLLLSPSPQCVPEKSEP